MYSTRYSCQILMKIGIFSTDFSKNTQDIKFCENPSSESRIVLCGRTDMTKLIVTFCNFSNAPKNE